jgi:hypothetical protein
MILNHLRIILSISLILWYTRLLHFLLVTRKLGIKVYMIGKMVRIKKKRVKSAKMYFRLRIYSTII